MLVVKQRGNIKMVSRKSVRCHTDISIKSNSKIELSQHVVYVVIN